VIYLLFFLSGAAGLIYEIVWSRELGLLFGHTVHAAAVVLGAYFAGMALGYLWSGRLAGRLKRPLAGYGTAELCVAAWAVATPHVLQLFTLPALAALLNHPQPGVQLTVRAVLAFLVLLPATVALGATLPFIAQHLSNLRAAGTSETASHSQSTMGARRTALAYACNTVGAFVGVLAATFALILLLGVRESGYLAAGISAACGIAALLIARLSRGGVPSRLMAVGVARAGAASGISEASADAEQPSTPLGSWYALAALSGAGTLGLQVLYTRMFALTFHNSTYTFGGVVAVFLLALAAGSAAVSRYGARVAAQRAAYWACLLGAPAVLLSVSVFQHFTRLGYFTAPDGFLGYVLCALGFIAGVVFIPTALLGAVLPMCFMAAAREASLGQAVGRLTAVNTVAAAAGALGTSFLMLPLLGLWRSFALYAFAYLIAGLLGLYRHPLLRRFTSAASWVRCAAFVVAVVAAVSVTSWPQSVVPKSAKLLYERETPYGLINVLEGAGGALQLRENNHYVLGGSVGAGSEFRQGRLPLLLHPAPREVCFLGLATGVTASAALADPAVELTTAVELVPEVVTAARLFGKFNGGVVVDPRVQIVANDARHYLYATGRQFDVIVSDLFVPWHSQTGYLYTVEHYRAARARLKPGGLFCQWLPLYQVGPRELALIADSFASVFPVTTLWRGELGVDGAPLLALVGSEQPLRLDGDALAGRLATLADAPWGRDEFLLTPEAWLQLYVGTWPYPGSTDSLSVSSIEDGGQEVRSTGDVRPFGETTKDDGQAVRPTSLLNTDDHPRVEFLAPISNRQNVMLKGSRLSEYYVDVLSKLAPSGLVYTPRPGQPALSLNANQLAQLRGS